MKPTKRIDVRTQRTRKALLGAFFELLLAGRYEDITVAQIVARAGVSRSAFYAHYAGKDALLAASIAWPFSVLANTLRTDDIDALIRILDHFWTNRALARGIFQEPVRKRMIVVLTDQVEAILEEGGAWKRGPLVLPSRLAAIQLAEMLFAPVQAWLFGESRCSSETLAIGLKRASAAALEGMALPASSGRR